ncbi:MAG: AAA family ATPase [Chloroflexota bacterium]|nr:AAA family ATPase [Chloroflexota bacterium]
MSEKHRVPIPLLATGVPGLDAVLGGGLPEYSFNLISGTPGAGKTTLTHQIMFANAAPQRPALYFTVMGEPPIKMLRYQQQMDFFDSAKVGDSVHFIDLSEVVVEAGLDEVLERIVQQVETTSPGIVIVDSFQAVVRAATAVEDGELSLQSFVQRLAVHLTNWQATTFLIGEYRHDQRQNNPLLTVADGIFSLSQSIDRNSVVRNAVFEEHPQEYMRRAANLGVDLEAMEREGSLKVLYIRPLDLSPDETLHEIREAVLQIKAQRVVIDSISGFELALAPTFRDDFREALYRLVGALTGTGITVLMIMEIVQSAYAWRSTPVRLCLSLRICPTSSA